MAQSREMSSELFARFMNDLTNNHIAELAHSQLVHERIGGIMAVGTSFLSHIRSPPLSLSTGF
jgi:hypothetical protein